MTNYANSASYGAYLSKNNISLDSFLGGRTSGHAAQLRADNAYNGSYDVDDDIFAGEPLYLESEVA